MGQWVSSKEFAESKCVSLRALQLKIQRKKQKIFSIDTYFFMYQYKEGIGRGGKVLRIWSEPFKTQAEAESFMQSYTQERVAYLSNTDSHKTQSSALTFVQSQHATTLEPISQTQVTTPTTLTTPHKIGTSSV